MNSSWRVATALACLVCVSALELNRYDFENGLEEVPSDLGDYNFVTCEGEGEDRSCELNDEELNTYIRVGHCTVLRTVYILYSFCCSVLGSNSHFLFFFPFRFPWNVGYHCVWCHELRWDDHRHPDCVYHDRGQDRQTILQSMLQKEEW